MLFHQVLVFCSDCVMILVDQNEILMEKLRVQQRSKSGREKGLLHSLIILHRRHKEYLI